MSKFNPYKHGISISSLQKWIVCRERYRLYAVDGLIERPEWDEKLHFGKFVGGALEVYGGELPSSSHARAKRKGLSLIKKLASEYSSHFLSDEADIIHWSKIAAVVFEEYLEYYADFYATHTPYDQEYQINHPISLSSKRSIFINGYIDEIFRHKKTKKHVLIETKCRGYIDEEATLMDLNLDIQTMTYWDAFVVNFKNHRDLRYNVIRRPAQRMKKRPKKETPTEFYARIRKEIRNDPGHYFYRYTVTISNQERKFYLDNVLRPLLEDYLDWWDRVSKGDKSRHWIRPFGVYDALSLSQRGDYFDYITSKSKSSLIPKPRSNR